MSTLHESTLGHDAFNALLRSAAALSPCSEKRDSLLNFCTETELLTCDEMSKVCDVCEKGINTNKELAAQEYWGGGMGRTTLKEEFDWGSYK